MNIREALEIVLQLAEDSVLDPRKCDEELLDAAAKQAEAVAMVQSYDFQFEEEEPPSIDDSVKYCPNCETPNQFGELCPRCAAEFGDL